MSDKKPLGLAVPNPDRRQCTAHSSRTGERCKKPPIRGATVCASHGGAAKHVRRRAAERLIEASDSLMAALLKIAVSAESEAVRLAAIKDALDRAGFQPAHMIKLGIGQEEESSFDALLKEIISDPDLITDEHPERRALPASDRGWGDEWLPDETIPGEVIREPDPPRSTPASPPRGKRLGTVVKVPAHIRTGLRLDPDAARPTFGP